MAIGVSFSATPYQFRAEVQIMYDDVCKENTANFKMKSYKDVVISLAEPLRIFPTRKIGIFGSVRSGES